MKWFRITLALLALPVLVALLAWWIGDDPGEMLIRHGGVVVEMSLVTASGLLVLLGLLLWLTLAIVRWPLRFWLRGARRRGRQRFFDGLLCLLSGRPLRAEHQMQKAGQMRSLRLSALMGQRVVYVMTHDSIGLGEDGPTHQPVEHLAALRAIPNLNVFRPADAVEVAECWELALLASGTPSILALTRQALPTLRTGGSRDNLCAKGGYVLAEAGALGPRHVTILATGSEVSLAMEAREQLAKSGVQAAVVSMPCWELFAAQPADYRKAVLGSAPRIAVEAAIGMGWERWLGDGGVFVGMDGFGASAPAPKLFEQFGITAAHVAAAARKLVG